MLFRNRLAQVLAQGLAVSISLTVSAEEPPVAPVHVYTKPYESAAALFWSPVPTAESYNVYQGIRAGAEGKTPLMTGIVGTQFAVSDLQNGKTYYFTVAAVGASGIGAMSKEVSVSLAPLPTAPTHFAATAFSRSANLSWTSSDTATSYEIYRSDGPNGKQLHLLVSGITATHYALAGLSENTTYYFVIKAVNASGSSSPSEVAVVKPLQ